MSPVDHFRFQLLGDQEKAADAGKYYGYPEFTRFMAASDDCFLLRRFSGLGARTLLLLQHQIEVKEKAISMWDERTMKLPGQGGCGSLADDMNTARGVLLMETVPLLQQYCEYV